MSRELTREVFERGHAVAVLPFDPARDQVVLIEQFRVGALGVVDHPWLLEAGGRDHRKRRARPRSPARGGRSRPRVPRPGPRAPISRARAAARRTCEMFIGRVDAATPAASTVWPTRARTSWFTSWRWMRRWRRCPDVHQCCDDDHRVTVAGPAPGDTRGALALAGTPASRRAAEPVSRSAISPVGLGWGGACVVSKQWIVAGSLCALLGFDRRAGIRRLVRSGRSWRPGSRRRILALIF